MKNAIVILALSLFCFGLSAAVIVEPATYVKTGDQVYFGQDLKMGLFNYKVIDADGVVTKIRNRDVVAYTHNSRHYESLPVICKTSDTLCFAMMEYVTQKSGLNLYRYANYEDGEARFEFFVFKNGEFYLRIDQENVKTTLPFFGIKVV